MQVSCELLVARSCQLRRAEFANDSNSCAGAETGSARLNHGDCISSCADPARGLYARMVAYYAAHQRDIFRSGRAGKSSGGFYEVGFHSKAELAGNNFFFECENRRLK